MSIDCKSRISKRVQNLQPSPIRRFFGMVESMPDAISLSIGEPDFVTPWRVRETGIFSLEKGYTHYTANLGLIELRREIAKYLSSRFGLDYDPNTEILVTVGVSEGLDLTMRTLLNEGDRVIVPQPSYVAYPATITMAGGEPIVINTYEKDNFQLTADTLEQAVIESGAKIALIGFPNNPTGAILPKERLSALADVAKRHDLLMISDEIYLELTYGRTPVSFAALPGMRERTILLSGFSKAFAMTGWRLGYVAAPAEIIANMNKIHGYTCMCASTPAQKAAIEALQYGMDDVVRMRDEYNMRRRVIVNRLHKMGLQCFEPEGAFYAFPSIANTGLSSTEFAERLLMEEHVAVVPGNAFGECGEGYIRCSYATSLPLIEEAMARMQRFIDKL
ncbi:MAG TPA: aminotransferase class I/II-fold pyridoxal phosphate-dependent enzyme [Armatimonadota bacterium]|nr:aminotransferase class I/II-fold pyridoxal phosphate-dependent enzyme [Armatimonadota bacterium]